MFNGNTREDFDHLDFQLDQVDYHSYPYSFLYDAYLNYLDYYEHTFRPDMPGTDTEFHPMFLNVMPAFLDAAQKFTVDMQRDLDHFRREIADLRRERLLREAQALAAAKRPYVKAVIPNELRWAVWERDNFTCKHCGSRRSLAVDHIYPESKGGPTTLDNCQTLCKSCNSRKGDRVA